MMLTGRRRVFFPLVVAVSIASLSVILLLVFRQPGEPALEDPAEPPAPVVERSVTDEVPADDSQSTDPVETANGAAATAGSGTIRVRPVGDEAVRRGIRFREYTVTTSPRLTLGGMEIQSGLGVEAPREERILDRLLELGAVALERESSLWRELEADLNRLGVVRAAYLVPTETREVLQFVLFHEEQASLVYLYLSEGRVDDGEVIPRDWSRRSALFAGSSADGPMFP